MITVTQDQVLRAVRQRLITALALPESRVYLTQEPIFTEGMDFAIQVSPIAVGSVSEFNRSGLGFVTERFAVTTFVRSASDSDIRQNRQLAGPGRGILSRQSSVRAALIQQMLGGLLQVAIRFVSSGAIKQETRSGIYLSSTDIYVCSYALAMPVGGVFRFGWSTNTPTWSGLSEEVNFTNSLRYTAESPERVSPTEQYLWFAFPSELHALSPKLITSAGEETFYRNGFGTPSGTPAIGTVTDGDNLYYLYRRAYPTVASKLIYEVEVG